jgi:general secretion pathway protein A
MYKRYYGLLRNPFELLPDSGTLFLSETHKEGLATLRYGILSKKGFLLLTGGVGTGKTTLINVLVKSVRPIVNVCVLSNPLLSSSEFFLYIASELGLSFTNKVNFLRDFSDFLKKKQKKYNRTLLIFDEAQALPVELLEEIRLLSNLAGDNLNVLSIFLVGQPELLDRLADARLLPLRQRIGIRFHLTPFSSEDTQQYILFRLNKAGARNPQIFSKKAMEIIFQTTHGNPRLINVLCDHALISGFSKGELSIDEVNIMECIQELHLPGDTATFDLLPLSSRKKRKRRRLVLLLIALFLALLGILLVFPYRLGLELVTVIKSTLNSI